MSNFIEELKQRLNISSLRDWLNENSMMVTVVAAVVMAGAVYVMLRSGGAGGAPHNEAAVGQGYFYDTVTGEYFTDAADRYAPFPSPAGNEAVGALFFSCGDCSEEQRFVGYYEKLTDKSKQIIENAEHMSDELFDEVGTLLISSTAKAGSWVPMNSPEGRTILDGVRERCPSRQLRRCRPGE